jgi:hypothetical protein
LGGLLDEPPYIALGACRSGPLAEGPGTAVAC